MLGLVTAVIPRPRFFQPALSYVKRLRVLAKKAIQ